MGKGKTFLGKIIKSVGSFIKKFLSKIDPETKKWANIAIDIANAVKSFRDSSLGEFSLEAIKTLIPGKWDDMAIDWITNYIDTKLVDDIIKLKFIKELADIPDPIDKAIYVLNTVRQGDIKEQTGFYMLLAAAALEAAKDGEITQAEAMVIQQIIYHN